jgi:hypothetical protein
VGGRECIFAGRDLLDFGMVWPGVGLIEDTWLEWNWRETKYIRGLGSAL